ncbi:MAG: lysine--tRNA ligase [Chlamydiales bacterium]|nr:lysine--tRNA ligase [Chlamydiales bacterium]
MKDDYRDNEEYQNRLRKLDELMAMGIDPYPHSFTPTNEAESLLAQYGNAKVGSSEEAEKGTTPLAVVAGRLMLFRAMGKNAFAHIQDKGGRIQVMFNRDNTQVTSYSPEGTGEEVQTPLKLIEKKFDLGDIIGIEGHLFHTQKGELTIYAKKVTLLSKSLLSLPEKHSGLSDKEIRYRKRWLDLISHTEVQKTFRDRSQILRLVRNFFEELNFLEVETPVLQNIYGGAAAKPFTTHLNALDQSMFLRISLEIPLKKLLIGGMDRVYEIGKVFRNEGIDRTHNPEFTMLEAYASYWDYNDMMRVTETLLETIALALHNSTVVTLFNPETNTSTQVDFKAPWRRMTMKESIKHYANIDMDALSDDDLRKILNGLVDPKELAKCNRGLLTQHIFENKVEEHLVQPHHITDHPIETTPLCKPHRDPKDRASGLIERFESFVMTKELANAYSELNDPVLQRELLEQQAAKKDAGDEEANPMDDEFLEAICQGMPPAGGLGIGIDRLTMLFTNSHSIRDVLYFPMMRPLTATANIEEAPVTQ